MWSHYADKHRGVALEVDVDDECVVPVRYTVRRVALDVPKIMASGGFTADLAEELARTKSSHWAYEEEIRVPIDLPTCVVDGHLRFEKLSDALKVTGIVAGSLCQLTASEVEKVLPRGQQLKLQWARLAFGSYNVVRNKLKPVQDVYGAA